MINVNGSCQAIERTICRIWADLLGREVQPHDNFFDIGGDSLKVVDVVIAARKQEISLRSSAVFRNPTPARLAEALTVGAARGAAGVAATPPAALTADPGRSPGAVPGRPPVPVAEGPEPLFLVHSDHLTGAERDAARAWVGRRPVRGLVTPGTGGTELVEWTVAGLAERHADELTRTQADRRYHLAGIGSGAYVAFELARLLRSRAQDVALLALIRPTVPTAPGPVGQDDALRAQLASTVSRFGLRGDESGDEVLRRMRDGGWYDADTGAADLPRLQRASAATAAALSRYRPEPYEGPVILVQDHRDADATEEIWGPALTDCRVHWVDYGVDSLHPVLGDAEVARIMRAELTP